MLVIQILAFTFCFGGIGAVIAATASNEWKVTSRATSVITATWVFQGLWMSCAGNALGAFHCRPHFTIFRLEAYKAPHSLLLILLLCHSLLDVQNATDRNHAPTDNMPNQSQINKDMRTSKCQLLMPDLPQLINKPLQKYSAVLPMHLENYVTGNSIKWFSLRTVKVKEKLIWYAGMTTLICLYWQKNK